MQLTRVSVIYKQFYIKKSNFSTPMLYCNEQGKVAPQIPVYHFYEVYTSFSLLLNATHHLNHTNIFIIINQYFADSMLKMLMFPVIKKKIIIKCQNDTLDLLDSAQFRVFCFRTCQRHMSH